MKDLCLMVSNSLDAFFSGSAVSWEARTTALEIKFHFAPNEKQTGNKNNIF